MNRPAAESLDRFDVGTAVIARVDPVGRLDVEFRQCVLEESTGRFRPHRIGRDETGVEKIRIPAPIEDSSDVRALVIHVGNKDDAAGATACFEHLLTHARNGAAAAQVGLDFEPRQLLGRLIEENVTIASVGDDFRRARQLEPSVNPSVKRDLRIVPRSDRLVADLTRRFEPQRVQFGPLGSASLILKASLLRKNADRSMQQLDRGTTRLQWRPERSINERVEDIERKERGLLV